MPYEYCENELDFNSDSGFSAYSDDSFESDLADILALLKG
jgi:hypothetical protein